MALSIARRVEVSSGVVVDWRRDELVRGGYPRDLADEIARREDIDLHGALALRSRGCPSALAWEILR